MSESFGQYFAQLRRNRANVSLRQFCRDHGFDPGNLSKIERGKLPPPGRPKLEQYATALGLEDGSDEWLHLFDLAAATRGEIPAEVMADEDVVAALPVFFRTLRGDRVSDEELEALIDKLRKA